MVDGAKRGEFLRKHQKQLEVLAIILLVLAFGSASIHIGDTNFIFKGDNSSHSMVFPETETDNGFDLPKIIEDICHRVFSQRVNCLDS